MRKSVYINISAPDLRGEVEFSTSGGYEKQMPAQDAYDLAFNCLRTKFSEQSPLWNLTSAKRWGKEPANAKQRQLIGILAKKKKVNVADVMENLTKLQASCLIERLK
jgi:hypothetical protein